MANFNPQPGDIIISKYGSIGVFKEAKEDFIGKSYFCEPAFDIDSPKRLKKRYGLSHTSRFATESEIADFKNRLKNLGYYFCDSTKQVTHIKDEF